MVRKAITGVNSGQKLVDRIGEVLKHPFLLLVRLYWGWNFFVAGRGKLFNPDQAASTFEMWEVPLPKVSAIVAGTAETCMGLALVVGLFSRLAAIPLIGVMTVAYFTAHAEEVESIADFIAAPPFNHLMAALIVLIFGPGIFSVDYLIKRWLSRE